MAELEHVVKTFSLLEAAEKEQPFLTREQKQDLYRIAFHKESMEEVEKIILQLQAPHAGKEEKERILSALRQSKGSRQEAALLLGISTTTLWRKMKKYQISENYSSLL